jgi:hypothetical protein
MPPPMWFPDPDEKADFRWFDGLSFTAIVAEAGQIKKEDPRPNSLKDRQHRRQRIGVVMLVLFAPCLAFTAWLTFSAVYATDLAVYSTRFSCGSFTKTYTPSPSPEIADACSQQRHARGNDIKLFDVVTFALGAGGLGLVLAARRAPPAVTYYLGHQLPAPPSAN